MLPSRAKLADVLQKYVYQPLFAGCAQFIREGRRALLTYDCGRSWPTFRQTYATGRGDIEQGKVRRGQLRSLSRSMWNRNSGSAAYRGE
jgi:hypothetical protein